MDELVKRKTWSTFLCVNGYRLLGCIGRGSFGDVFAVSRSSDAGKMAIKRVVSRHDIRDDAAWLAETQALMTLRHSNIIQLKEILVAPSMACLVLELAPYGNLEQWAERQGKTFTKTFVGSALAQITSAVACCHDLDLAHRDINPSNVLIFSDTLVKLADFGLSFRCSDIISGDERLCEDYLGHEAYLAPEVKALKPFPAKPADIWSLGCLLYFMITCSHPHHNCNCNEICAAINGWQDRSEISYVMVKLSHLCHVDPSCRPLAADILTNSTNCSKKSILN